MPGGTLLRASIGGEQRPGAWRRAGFPAVFRMACMDSLEWLVPWEFSPTLVASFIVAIVLFVRGQRVHHVTLARQVYFWSGMVLLYLSMHTRLDYYAERMFFIHRAQHLVLHHLGPLLVMAAFPGQVMRAGLPMAWRLRLRDFLRTGTGRATVAVLTNKIFVPALFVFLVLVWLLPSVQFYSMLDWRLYRLMNWSVVISGFMYWNLILDRRPSPPAAMSPGGRDFAHHHHGAADGGGRRHRLLRKRPLSLVRAVRPRRRHVGADRPDHRRPDHVDSGRAGGGGGLDDGAGHPDAPVRQGSAAQGRSRCAGAGQGPRRLGLIRPFSGISPFRPEPAVAYSGISPWYLRPSATVAWNMPALLPQS